MTKDLQRWSDPAMFPSEPMLGQTGQAEKGEITPRVYLLSATPDPLGSVAAMAMMYEGRVVRDISREVTDDDRRHYWEESQKTHLRAPWEAIDFHFMVEGVTRSFTHQMVRQRTAVYAQESLRFAVKEGFASEVPLPPSLMGLYPESEGVGVWKQAIVDAEASYQALIDMGVPAEDARGLLPHSITTRLNYKTNFRNLAEHIGNRLCTQAQFEWRLEVTDLMRAVKEYVPRGLPQYDWQFKLISESKVFRPICYSLGHCPFTADFDRDCTIRPRVEEGKFEDIDIREWLMDPLAANRGVG